MGHAGCLGSLTGRAAPVQTRRRLTGSPLPPLPAPGLTARQTQHHTCCLLRTTTPASLSPPLAASAPLGSLHARPKPEREPGSAGRRGRPGRRPAGRRWGRGGGRAPRESGLAGTAQPEAPRPGPLAARPPANSPGWGWRANGEGVGQAARGPRGGGSRARAGREGAAAAPQPEAWRRAAGGGAGRGGACSGPPTPRGGEAGPGAAQPRA